MDRNQRSASNLRVYEIFHSIQGESNTIGFPTTFVRLTGCPLRCVYCDTEYAFHGGQWMSLDEILTAIKAHKTPHITITGGEPLAQKPCISLLTSLCDEGYKVAIETSGALDISHVDSRASIVMDLKTPGSGECDRNRMQNLQKLSRKDLIKIVICDIDDYNWAQSIVEKYQLNNICEVIFSPSYGQLNHTNLAKWILRDELQVRMQIQLHKILWGEEQGR